MKQHSILNRGMGNMGVVVAVLVVIAIVVGVYYYTSNREAEVSPELTEMITVMSGGNFDYSGVLEDVTNGEDVLGGINTGGNASGVVQAHYTTGDYNLVAVFEGLPDPVGTDFYEGWIVRTGADFDVVSTGRLVRDGERYKNLFESDTDLTDHMRYVLTLEPDDGDPGPAEDHIVEGNLSR